MHLGRFNYAVMLISDSFEKNDFLQVFDQAIAQLQAYVSAPNEVNSLAFRKQIDALLAECGEVPLDCSAASFKQVVVDTGGEQYFGSGLERSLRDLFEKQSMTPSELLVSLQTFRKNLGRYVSSIKTISKELSELEVEFVELEQEQFEFGAMFPKELVGNSIENIQVEMEHLNRLFKALNEMMGKGAESPIVRNISSSWWQFFLELDAQQIAAITFAIERIVALYKSNLEIQKIKQDVEKNNLGQDIVTMLNNKIDEALKIGMEEISKEVRDKFQKNADAGRCNELEIQLRMELFHIAKRINQGAAYEVRAGLPNKPKKIDEETADEQTILTYKNAMQKYEEQNQLAREINSAGVRLADAIEEQSGETQLLTDYAKLTDSIEEGATIKK